MQEKTCHRCNQTKPLTDEFFSFHKTKDGTPTCGWCRECHREYSREYKTKMRKSPQWSDYLKASKSRMRTTARGREYLNRCKRQERKRRRCRLRKLPATYTERQWNAAISHWQGRCAYCGKECTPTQDHYIPIASKECPGHVAHNIVPACIECNVDKSNKPAREWLGDDSKADAIEQWLTQQKTDMVSENQLTYLNTQNFLRGA